MPKSDQNSRTAKARAPKYVVVKRGGSFKAVEKTLQAPRSRTAIEQRVHGADGRLKTVYAVDFGSETFGSDLGYAFKKNVAQARRENKKKFGTADGVVRKG